MPASLNAIAIRLDRLDPDLLDKIKGRLEVQLKQDPGAKQDVHARIVDEPDEKSQSLGGAEAFLVIYSTAAVLAATRLVIREFVGSSGIGVSIKKITLQTNEAGETAEPVVVGSKAKND